MAGSICFISGQTAVYRLSHLRWTIVGDWEESHFWDESTYAFSVSYSQLTLVLSRYGRVILTNFSSGIIWNSELGKIVEHTDPISPI
jgi:hypothetical protein